MALDSSRRRDFLILAAERQERERQIGADTSKGYFMSDATDIGQYNGDRSFQMVVRTGENVQSRQALRDAEPLGFVINDGKIYINLLGMWVCGYSVNANTTYHVVATFNKATMRAKLYVAGAFVSESKPRETEATYSGYFSIGNNRSANNPVYPFQEAIMLNRDFDYELTAEEVMSLDNNGDPVEYVLPGWYKHVDRIVEQASPKNWIYGGNASYDSTTDEFHIVSAEGEAAYVTPLASSGETFSRYDTIYCIRLKVKGYGMMAVVDSGALTRPISSRPSITPASAAEYTEYSFLIAFSAINRIIFKRSSAGDWYLRDIEISTVGCIAEYLPQNLVPAGPGERIPVKITENKTYTWTGVDDTTYSIIVGTSRKPVLGQWYLIKGAVSNYETSTPYISADTGYTEFALPRRNNEFSVFAQCRSISPSSYYFTFRGGNRNTDRRLTITIESIEPINNIASTWLDSAKQLPLNNEYLPPLLESINGYDLTANGTPEIVYPESSLWYGIEYDVTKEASSCVRIGDMSLHQHLPIQSRMRGCLLDDSGKVIEYLPSADWTGTARDGSRGQVMIEIPKHYRKHETEGNIRRTKISEYPLPGYHAVPKMYISAYEATVQRSTGKLASVVNTSADYRGGNNQADWDALPKTQLGKPATYMSRTAFRTAARKRGTTTEWNCMDYNAYITLAWLYYIEYGNLNCQLAFNAQKDSNGYAQGGLGNGVTTWNSTEWNNFSGYYPIIPCGTSDELGNASGEVAYTLEKAEGENSKVFTVPRYRGIENPFGHIWKWADGMNMEVKTDANGGTSKVFVAIDPANYNDSNYNGYTLRGLAARQGGYTKEMIFGEHGDLIASLVGESSTTYWCDYYYTYKDDNRMQGVLFGGNTHDGVLAGFGSALTYNAPSLVSAYAGSRLCFIPKIR